MKPFPCELKNTKPRRGENYVQSKTANLISKILNLPYVEIVLWNHGRKISEKMIASGFR